jgi:ribosome biogenesis GTPase
MRELGLIGASEGLEDSFSEFGELSGECRFSDCSHTNEPGCAVLAAVDEGVVPAERYNSYLKLKKETEHHDMSYVERRKKDKEFGRMFKNYKKHLRKDK